MVDRKAIAIPYPKCIAVIGGGRWARVLAEVICDIAPATTRLFIYTPNNSDSMTAWALEQGFRQRIDVFSSWSFLDAGEIGAMIVVNAASDHEAAIEKGINANIPVLVEKPVSLSYSSSKRLADLAQQKNICFASAHIFLYADYLKNFSRLVSDLGGARAIHVDWSDPVAESRYGEQKQFDSGLPIYADWLPHVLSILGFIMQLTIPPKFNRLGFHRGGCQIELEFMLNDVPCFMRLVRNGDIRKRIIDVETDQQRVTLDFSKEPGTITNGSSVINADPDWENSTRPSAKMIAKFLSSVEVGGDFDERLDINIGLNANLAIDAVRPKYYSALLSLLLIKLNCLVCFDEDLQYALREMLLSKGPLPSQVVNDQIEQIRRAFVGGEAGAWLEKLAVAKTPSMLIRSIVK